MKGLSRRPEVRADKALDQSSVQRAITEVCEELEQFLLGKNEAYGNSALEPIRLFSRCSPLEGIRVRLDDKLQRLKAGHEYPGDDTIKDLTGYLVLYLVGKRLGLEEP